MGNCCFGVSPSIYRVSSNAKSESPKMLSPSLVKEEEEKERSKLPSNPAEVEDLLRDSASNPLIAFTFNELKEVTENFRQDYFLGGGGFGSVYKGFINENVRKGLQTLQVAVKVHDGDNSFQGHREWLAEVIFLGQLSHPNLVKLIGYCCEDNHRVLIYELLPRGSVEANLFSRVLLPLPWDIRMKIAYGAAKGLAFLHEAKKPVIYRDFKTSNILLDEDCGRRVDGYRLARDAQQGSREKQRQCGHVGSRLGHAVTRAAVNAGQSGSFSGFPVNPKPTRFLKWVGLLNPTRFTNELTLTRYFLVGF
ncbi:probable serine/threonine-protein kinase PBL16 isoform X2 [Dendrobium catenatum]|uniref:probable serine/threonine-protein kinase PBL16 isoform X2 n=1 Tax=Dendrobium catenatum TaxID=906689 RepID=UPI00109F6519|nr:probable serine/threonine-protein kinase PBL16 isoform X2 [Dendrobium catenatum]